MLFLIDIYKAVFLKRFKNDQKNYFQMISLMFLKRKKWDVSQMF